MTSRGARLLGLGLLLTAGLDCSSDPAPDATDAGGLDAGVTDAGGLDATDVATTDAAPDKDVPTSCPTMAPFEAGSVEGAASPLQVPSGGVRAGRLEASELPQNRTGLGEWRPGDYALVNERVAVIIEAARDSSGYNPWGGMPIGAARYDGGRLVDAADFGEVITGLGRFTFNTRSVTVLRDGTDGTAVVRSLGRMRAIPFIDEFARVVAPGDYSEIDAAVDYTLRPGADHVDVSVTFDVQTPGSYGISRVLHAFFQGNRLLRFIPERGFVADPGRPRALGWVDPLGVSWAWRLPGAGQTFTPFISESGFDSFTSPPVTIPGCAQTRFEWAQLVVGEGVGLDGLQRSLARADGTTLREVQGVVNDARGMPVAGARVHVTSADGMTYLDRVDVDAMGRFTAHVPMGDVRMTAFRVGYPVGAPVTVAASASSTTLSLGATGFVRVRATEGGDPAPARVQVFPAAGGSVPTVPDAFGENLVGRGRLHAVFPPNGDVTLPVPPGRWRVVVSRGWLYEITDVTVDVTADATQEVTAAFTRVMPREGVLCGDFHIHTHRSPDSDDDARFKLASGAGEGLDVMARSDHEYVSDFQPLVEEMGLERWVRGVGSIELTTFTYGHFGVFPLVPDPSRPNGGNFQWANRLPPAVFADVRARPENPTLVINHPRGASNGAYFDASRYNSTTRTAGRPDYWDTRFNAVEFFNDSSFEENEQQVADWFSFLAGGRRVAAVGSSDSHHINSSPVGYPRTCMYLGTDTPAMATPQAIGAAVGAGRSFISGGVWLTVTAAPGAGAGGGTPAQPGQDLMGAGAEAVVSVVARAPSWVRAQRLQVFVDGAAMPTVALTDATRDPMDPVVRYRGDFRVPVAASGSWVIVAVSGDELTPVYSGRRAFAVSNPIYLRR